MSSFIIITSSKLLHIVHHSHDVIEYGWARSTPQPSKMDKLSPHGAAVVVLEGDEGDDELMTSPDDDEHEACGPTLPVEFVSLLF